MSGRSMVRRTHGLVMVLMAGALLGCGASSDDLQLAGASPELLTSGLETGPSTASNPQPSSIIGAPSSAPVNRSATVAALSPPPSSPAFGSPPTGLSTALDPVNVVTAPGGAPRVPQSAADELLANTTNAMDAYRIGPADYLEVAVFKVPDLSKTLLVADTGTINLPVAGEVPVAGLTPREAEQKLTKVLGDKYLQNPQVTVHVKEYNSQRVVIDGAVKNPGVHPFRGRMTLLQLVATAGGLTDTAESDVIVFRGVGDKKTVARFNLDEIKAASQPDPRLQSGDLVIVNTSLMKTTFNNVLKVLPMGGMFFGLF